MNNRHGNYIATVSGNIISVTMLGAFNIDGVKACIKDVQLIINNLGDNSFYLMSNILQFSGATPDAYDEINKFNCWLRKQNVVALAVVNASSAILSIFSMRIASAKHKKIQIFTNEFDAINWLKEQK